MNRRRFLAAGPALTLAACAGQGIAAGPNRRHRRGERHAALLRGRGQRRAGGARPRVHARHPDVGRPVRGARARFRVIRYDARGFGKSPPPKSGEPYSNADDLAALARTPRRAQGARRRSVDGRQVRARLRGHLSRRPALADGHRRRDRRLAMVAGVDGAYAPIVDAGRGGTWRGEIAVAGHPLFAPARETGGRGPAETDGRTITRAGTSSTRTRSGRFRRPRRRGSARYACPRSRSWATAIWRIFSACPKRLARDIPGARRVTVPSSGHMSNMEAPAAVNGALRGFLSRA